MLEVTVYKRPNGVSERTVITNIRKEDVDFFQNGGYSVSVEELSTGHFVLYSTTGLLDEDGEEHEELYVVLLGQTCEDAMHELRKRVEYMLMGKL